MRKYEIQYIKCSEDDIGTRQIDEDKTPFDIFVRGNITMNACVAMVMHRNENEIPQCGLPYGKYLGGFKFEGYELLPPLCILQIVSENLPHNAVYYDGTIYDPIFGVFSAHEYEQRNTTVLSYAQIFIPEAYEDVDWKPYIPAEIQAEFEKDTELRTSFDALSSMEQSKILNYIYPFSKGSSFKESRALSKPITPVKTQHIIEHIRAKTAMTKETYKSTWEELKEFETAEAAETLKKCGITLGMTVLDMGCGHGHYTIPASIACGGTERDTGKVFAVDRDGKVLKHIQNRAAEFNLKNITCLKTNEKGLSEYHESIDFIILYDVLHGMFSYTKADWGKTTKSEFVSDLISLLKSGGILSLALYNEIERKKISVKTKDGKKSFKAVPISHEEAIEPYIELMQANGLELHSVIENGGVHFDDFHTPAKWRKFGEIMVSSLERRNIYNFVKN